MNGCAMLAFEVAENQIAHTIGQKSVIRITERVIESFSRLRCDYLVKAVQCKGLSFNIVQPDDA